MMKKKTTTMTTTMSMTTTTTNTNDQHRQHLKCDRFQAPSCQISPSRARFRALARRPTPTHSNTRTRRRGIAGASSARVRRDARMRARAPVPPASAPPPCEFAVFRKRRSLSAALLAGQATGTKNRRRRLRVGLHGALGAQRQRRVRAEAHSAPARGAPDRAVARGGLHHGATQLALCAVSRRCRCRAALCTGARVRRSCRRASCAAARLAVCVRARRVAKENNRHAQT